MRRDDTYLLDMLIAARDAVSFLEALSREEFAASRLHQQAATKCLETMGEAAARIPEATRAANPSIPRREIIGMRHHLVHGYFEIDLDEVCTPSGTIFPRSSPALNLWYHQRTLDGKRLIHKKGDTTSISR